MGTLVVMNLFYLVYLDRVNRRNAKQVDSLTNKIIAPHTVSAATPTDTKLVPGGITLSQNNIPLSEADPEAIMEALEIETGRRER